MAPVKANRLRLHHTADGDTAHLRSVLDQLSHPFGARVDLRDGMLELRTEPR